MPVALFLPAPPYWLDPLLGLGAALLLLLLWRALSAWSLVRRLEERLRDALGPLTGLERGGLALVSALAEETFFRGALQPAWGFAAATLLFGLLHSGRGREMLLWTASALLAGALLGGLMLWRGNLCAPILCHALVNAVQLRRLSAPAPAGPHDAPPAA